jgi:hypothetical protein
MQINNLSTAVVQCCTSDSLEGEAFNGSPQRGTTNGCAQQAHGPRHRPPEVTGPGLPARGDHHAGLIVLDFDSTAATVIAVAFGAGPAVLAVGSAPRQQASVRHIMRPADLAPIWSRMPRRRCCAGPAPRRSSPTCGWRQVDGGWLRGRRLHSRRPLAAPVGTGCGRQQGELRGHHGAPTPYVVQEAGGLVAAPGEAGFVGKQRRGRAP